MKSRINLKIPEGILYTDDLFDAKSQAKGLFKSKFKPAQNSKIELKSSFQIQDISEPSEERPPSNPFKVLNYEPEFLPEECPTKMYCAGCMRLTGTIIKYEAEALSFWKRICCGNYEVSSTIIHCCRYCRAILAKYPNST